MDEIEKKRQHRQSSSSVDSLVLQGSSPVLKENRKESSEPEGRSLEAGRESGEEKKGDHGFVGRLRNLAGGRVKEKKRVLYPET